jgi:hypothetical protein
LVTTRTHSAWPTGANYYGIEEVDAVEILDDSDDEIWNVQLSDGEVRSVSLDKLNDLYRFSLIDDNAFVWQPGMQNWTRLSTLLGVDAPEPDEPYFVVMSPGNVKQATLEQLDDFYRHGVIEDGTLIWQNGMTEWRRLGSLAGVDTEVSQPSPVAPMPASVSTLAAVPPKTSRPAFVIPSAPPLALTIEPSEHRPNPAGRWFFRSAILAGVVMALIRNDLVFSVASKSRFADDYVRLERSLFGGPLFGTERSVERLVAATGGHLEPVRLPIAVVAYNGAQKHATRELKLPAPVAVPAAGAGRTEDVRSASSAGETAVSATTRQQNSGTLDSNLAAPSATSQKAVRTPKQRAATSKSTLRKNGNYFDPLNPSL